MDIPTLILLVLAACALALVAFAAPGVMRRHREWKRRQRLTPLQRAIEDISQAFNELAAAFVNALTPVVKNATVVMTEMGEALKVDTGRRAE